ncbi:hypothetical protein EG68_02167 [Paragonimus skrjabini miyazakii]|uniref:Uncharacterized protein n=1 Tax=Paragonimus skrjabini miyazakii TaxID=59628 RepID=A0A8S9Z589_9TREM|nr:hypothetical protein EG68_02167 [Paragonimus skrjabini miyazakii]
MENIKPSLCVQKQFVLIFLLSSSVSIIFIRSCD